MNVTFLYAGPHPAHTEWARSVNSKFVPNKTKIKLTNVSRLLKSITVVRKIPKDTDILLCEGGSDILTGNMWKKKNPTKKLVLIVDDPKLYFLPRMNNFKKGIYYRALESVDLFIPTTPMMKTFVPEKFQHKSTVVQLFVDYKRFYCKKPDLTPRNIIFVGWVGKEKGVDRIVSVFKSVNHNYPASRLYIVGDGPLRSKSGGNIIFTGYDPKPEKYLKQGSIYMNLARIEPFGIAILEAMSCGLIPIVSEGVGIKYAVEKVSPDLVVNSEKESIEITETFFEDENLREKYSKKCQKMAKTFTKEKSIKRFKRALLSF